MSPPAQAQTLSIEDGFFFEDTGDYFVSLEVDYDIGLVTDTVFFKVWELSIVWVHPLIGPPIEVEVWNHVYTTSRDGGIATENFISFCHDQTIPLSRTYKVEAYKDGVLQASDERVITQWLGDGPQRASDDATLKAGAKKARKFYKELKK